MHKYYIEFIDVLLWIEFFAALTGIFYFRSLKNSYWKWFSIYLVLIFIQEFFWFLFSDHFSPTIKHGYFGVFGIPVQFIFLFWLYAFKSLKNKKLFLICTLIYGITIPLYIEKISVILSVNYAVGTTIIMILVLLEFIKQIRNDEIVRFKENKMFYINIGVILFYIGTYPFFAFYETFFNNYVDLYNAYVLYFRISSFLIYLLYIASFVWGKHRIS